MGIRGFARRLEHKGERVRLFHDSTGYSGDENGGAVYAVIDGASLAHHIHNEHCKTADRYSPTSHAYDPLVQAYLTFLDDLEKLGFTIAHIYFDGALPEHKTSTRIARLTQYAVQNEQIARRFAELQNKKQYALLSWPELFSIAAKQCKSTLAHGFMVAAIIEGIAGSKYASITDVVPGEADGYCASASRALGRDGETYIFTNDSDMLVYDSGARTKICMLSSFEASGMQSTAMVHDASKIAESVRLSDMIQVAYVMSCDQYCSFETAAKIVRDGMNEPQSDYQAFASQYDMPALTVEPDNHQQKQLRFMDPRIAEIVHQFRDAKATGTIHIRVFLPWLVDSPSRASAWRIGKDIRKLAYQILDSFYPTLGQIFEYDRKDTTISANEVTFDADLQHNLADFIAWLDNKQATLRVVGSSSMCWRLIAICVVLEWQEDNGRSLLSADRIWSLATAAAPRSYDELHLCAQLEAALYSIRMLGVIAEYAVNAQLDSTGSAPSPATLQTVKKLLGSMPTLQGMLRVEHDEVDPDYRQHVDTLLQSYIAYQDKGSTTDFGLQSRRKKPRKKRKKEVIAETKKQKLGSNPYDVLRSG